MKFDAQGKELPATAEKWAIVQDRTTGLFWEVKSDEDGVRATTERYKFSKAKKQLIKTLNEMKFGGFSDWRLPTTPELTRLRSDKAPFIDTDFFPNTQPSDYHSWYTCASGELVTEKVNFGSTELKGKSLHARAVRGKPPTE